jgi:hypothetical protein
VGEPWLLGLALITLCASCLGLAARFDGPTVARWELADASMLMSCAEEPSSNGEPLWCANPDSPHCTPGTPASESREPWLGPLVAAHVPRLTMPPYDDYTVRFTVSSGALLGHAWADGERLERPPRRG